MGAAEGSGEGGVGAGGGGQEDCGAEGGRGKRLGLDAAHKHADKVTCKKKNRSGSAKRRTKKRAERGARVEVSATALVAHAHTNIHNHRLLIIALTFANGTGVKALVDTGSTRTLITATAAAKAGILGKDLDKALDMKVADGSVRRDYITQHARVVAKVEGTGLAFDQGALIVPKAAFDVILGIDWVQNNAQWVDWNQTRIAAPGTSAAVDMVVGETEDDTALVEVFLEMEDGPEYKAKVKNIVPAKYHGCLGAFSKTACERLPHLRPGFDHEIRIKEGARPHLERLRHTSVGGATGMDQGHVGQGVHITVKAPAPAMPNATNDKPAKRQSSRRAS